MPAVSLDEAKAHCRVDYDDDDALIASHIAAAEAYVEAVGVEITPTCPAPVRQAALLLIGHFYENREAAGEIRSRAIAFGVDALLQPFREHAL